MVSTHLLSGGKTKTSHDWKSFMGFMGNDKNKTQLINLLLDQRPGPFSTLKIGFRSITFEKISELDSYFIHKHIIIKYTSSLI